MIRGVKMGDLNIDLHRLSKIPKIETRTKASNNKDFTITSADLAAAKNSHKYSDGDADVLAFELAASRLGETQQQFLSANIGTKSANLRTFLLPKPDISDFLYQLTSDQFVTLNLFQCLAGM